MTLLPHSPAINVIFDTTCPWCFIGKRRLEAALAQRPHLSATVSCQALLLNQQISQSGMSYEHYLKERLGGEENARVFQKTLMQAGASLGIAFDFERINTLPNTLASHALITLAKRAGCVSAVIDAIFTAYLCEGRDIGDTAVLLEIAEKNGISVEEAKSFLHSSLSEEITLAENIASRKSECRGVPAFIFNAHLAIIGAQEVPVFVRMLDVAVETALTPFPPLEQDSADAASSL